VGKKNQCNDEFVVTAGTVHVNVSLTVKFIPAEEQVGGCVLVGRPWKGCRGNPPLVIPHN